MTGAVRRRRVRPGRRRRRLAAGVALACAGATAAAADAAIIGATPSAAGSGAADGEACRGALAAAVRLGTAADVPGRCWRVGPVALGMTEASVERALGAPSRRLVTPQGIAVLYRFAAPPGPLVRDGRARFRLALLRYIGGRLALIANDPPTRGSIVGARCARRDPSMPIDSDADTGPLLRFDGIAVGDPVRRLAARFGMAAARNRSHDWYNYLPVPISFDVDPERARVTGFAVARDEAALTADWPSIEFRAHYDPASCALTAVDFTLAR